MGHGVDWVKRILERSRGSGSSWGSEAQQWFYRKPGSASRLVSAFGRNAYPLGPLGLAVLSLEVVLHIANLLTMDHEPRRETESLNQKT